MAYAIIRTGGKQFRAEPGKTLRIPNLVGEPGAKITFDDVILGVDGDDVQVGVPTLARATVTAEIVKHDRGEKIIVFKQKRRKNYSRKQGHRQGFTEVRITEVKLGARSEELGARSYTWHTRKASALPGTAAIATQNSAV